MTKPDLNSFSLGVRVVLLLPASKVRARDSLVLSRSTFSRLAVLMIMTRMAIIIMIRIWWSRWCVWLMTMTRPEVPRAQDTWRKTLLGNQGKPWFDHNWWLFVWNYDDDGVFNDVYIPTFCSLGLRGNQKGICSTTWSLGPEQILRWSTIIYKIGILKPVL